MTKVTLNDVNNLSGNPGSAQVVINNNNDLLEAAIENTLSRDGTSPNEMNADLDMNSNDILNVGRLTLLNAPGTDSDAVNKEYVDDALSAINPRLIPPGGLEGQALIKRTDALYDTEWEFIGDVTPVSVVNNINQTFVIGGDGDGGDGGGDSIPVPGPAGIAGATGATGPAGADGPAGAPGLSIILEGEPGEEGPPGPTGATGAAGSSGPQGVPGVNMYLDGEPGEEGPMGPPGPIGEPDPVIGATITRETTQAITTSTDTPIQFTVESRDDGGLVDLVGDNTKITIPTGAEGWYTITGNVQWAADTGNKRYAHIRLNGTAFWSSQTGYPVAAFNEPRSSLSVVKYLTAGNYVQLVVWQDDGADVNITRANFSCVRTAPTVLGQGPAGQDGPRGPAIFLAADSGEDGVSLPGPMGPSGPQGATGATGGTGPQGDPGANGAAGPTGPAGPAVFMAADSGEDGISLPGAAGPQGPAGSNGSQGPAGSPGTVMYLEPDPGDEGPRGIQGERGTAGAAGSQGPMGQSGSILFLEAEAGDMGMMGPPGPRGTLYTKVATLAGDQATAANTTPVTLTGLVFNYEVNSKYRIWAMGRVAPTAATTGCGFQFDLSSAVTAIDVLFYHQLANTGTLSGGHSIADDASVGVSSGMPGTSTYPVTVEGLLVTTTNTGTAQLRFRSETTAVTTCKAGFTLVVEKIA